MFTGAVLLFVPRWSFFGALIITCTVGTASLIALFKPALPLALPLVFTLLAATLARLARPRRIHLAVAQSAKCPSLATNDIDEMGTQATSEGPSLRTTGLLNSFSLRLRALQRALFQREGDVPQLLVSLDLQCHRRTRGKSLQRIPQAV